MDLTRTTVQEQTRIYCKGGPNLDFAEYWGWEQKYQEGCDLLQFASQCYWDQIERGMLHEHPATASSWNMECIAEVAAHPGVYTVVSDIDGA